MPANGPGKAKTAKKKGEVSNRRKVQEAPKQIGNPFALDDDDEADADGEGLFTGTTALIARPMVLDAATKAAAQQKIQDGRAEKKLAKKSKGAAANAAAAEAAQDAAPASEVGVIYLGHIPFGFFERQMKEFFSQFGTVTRLRLSRSKTSARSRGYAFIEFANSQVAAVVAETMNNYMMYGRVLECHVVSPDKVHADTFKGAGMRFRRIPFRQLAQAKHNTSRTEEQLATTVAKLVSKETRKRKRLLEEGIEYDFPGYAALAPSAALASPAPADAPAALADPAPANKKAKKAGKAGKAGKAVVAAAATTTTVTAASPAPAAPAPAPVVASTTAPVPSGKKGKKAGAAGAAAAAPVPAPVSAPSTTAVAAAAAKPAQKSKKAAAPAAAAPVPAAPAAVSVAQHQQSGAPAAKKRKLNNK